MHNNERGALQTNVGAFNRAAEHREGDSVDLTSPQSRVCFPPEHTHNENRMVWRGYGNDKVPHFISENEFVSYQLS